LDNDVVARKRGLNSRMTRDAKVLCGDKVRDEWNESQKYCQAVSSIFGDVKTAENDESLYTCSRSFELIAGISLPSLQ